MMLNRKKKVFNNDLIWSKQHTQNNLNLTSGTGVHAHKSIIDYFVKSMIEEI